MVLKLYGYDYSVSTNTRRVAAVLHEKKVDFEFIDVDLFKSEQKEESYKEKQPFGTVPCIDDDGFILYESRAICRYIATKYADQGTPLLPTDPKKAALAEQGIQIETTSFEAYASRYMVEKWLKPMLGAPGNEDIAAESRSKLANNLDVYEKILSKQKYIAGDELTLADLYHVPWGVLLPTVGCNEMETRPAVARWFNELKARPSSQATAHAIKSTST